MGNKGSPKNSFESHIHPFDDQYANVVPEEPKNNIVEQALRIAGWILTIGGIVSIDGLIPGIYPLALGVTILFGLIVYKREVRLDWKFLCLVFSTYSFLIIILLGLGNIIALFAFAVLMTFLALWIIFSQENEES